MDLDRKSKYEQLYNIKLPEFYKFVTDVMADFGYSMYRAVKEFESRRRIELWTYGGKDDQKALMWMEITKQHDTLDPYLTTDVLRTMNDENVTKLFFFTNGNLTADDKEVLEGKNHFIFATEDIVETLMNIEAKRSVKVVQKRKTVKTPSGVVLIKNFFKHNEIKKKQIRLRTSATPDLVGQYTRLVRLILDEIDKVPDINSIPPESKEKLKKIQFDLLPELAKTPSYFFPMKFSSLKNLIFSLINVTIIYIGNFVEYESEDELKKNREIIEELLGKMENITDQVLNYKSDMMFGAEKAALKVILTSGIIAFISIALLIVLKFGN